MLTFFGADSNTVIKVIRTGLIGVFEAVTEYILAEACVDGKSAGVTSTDELE